MKKYDNMLPTFIPSSGTPTPGSGVSIALSSSDPFQSQCLVFIPNARDKTIPSGGDVNGISARTMTTIFSRGYRERVTLASNGVVPVRWRRICVSANAFNLTGSNSALLGFYETTTVGMVRSLRLASLAEQGQIAIDLFRGTALKDYSTYLDAVVDTSKVNLIYDRTRVLQSTTSANWGKTYKFWYNHNRPITYNDNESGTSYNDTYISAANTQDMVVIDFFSGMSYANATPTATTVNMIAEGTYFWHER